MVKSRFNKKFQGRDLRSRNEGADCFTSFFQEDHVMNKNPTEPFFEFMRDHEVDLEKGEVRKVKK